VFEEGGCGAAKRGDIARVGIRESVCLSIYLSVCLPLLFACIAEKASEYGIEDGAMERHLLLPQELRMYSYRIALKSLFIHDS